MIQDIRPPSDLLGYYFLAGKWPHESVFPFEEGYPREFLECFGHELGDYYNWEGLLDNAIDDSLFEEYERRCDDYMREQSTANATFKFCIRLSEGFTCWRMKLHIADDEEPSDAINRFLRTLEFLTGIKISKERLTFRWPGKSNNSSTSDAEVVSQALNKWATVGIIPPPGHFHSSPWDVDELVPKILKRLCEVGPYLPLNHRFRIWTIVWGTGQLIKRLVDANPNFMERARSLGIGSYVFDRVLNAPIPAVPADELIPLELLESVTLLKGLVGYMFTKEMIDDDTGYWLMMDGAQFLTPSVPATEAQDGAI